MTAEETMFNEVLAALDQDQPARARDLLTRLIKGNPNNPQYWLYMSAVVETQRERIYCLKEAQKLAPDDPAVKRGLAVFGEGPVDPAQVIPLSEQRRNWQAALEREQSAQQQGRPLTGKRIAILAAAVIGLVGMIVLIVVLTTNARQEQASAARRTIVLPTAGPSSTFLPTPSPVVKQTDIPGVTPLPEELRPESPYTPTPLYVQTQHTISENFSAGMRAFGRGDFASAERFLVQASTDVPNAADIFYYIAESQRGQGKTDAALENYNLALDSLPGFAPALVGRARLRLLQENPPYEEILADLTAAVESDPAYAEAWLELAQVQLGMNNVEDARASLESAAGLEAGETSPLLYLYRAQASLQTGEVEAALADARRANQMDISLLAAYRTLGEIYHRLGEDENSIPPLAIYAKFATADPFAPALLGIAYARSGDTKQALEWLNKALELDDLQPEAYAWRGLVLLEQGENAKAYQDFDQALLLGGENFIAALGRARALLALKYPDEAFDQFNRVEKLAETDAQQGEYLFYYAQALEQVGNPGAALNNWKKLLALPATDLNEDWLELALARVSALSSPTPTATFTRNPTRTPTSSRTP